MLIPKTTIDAVRACIDCRMPFALYVCPNSIEPVFFADPGMSYGPARDRRFVVSPWFGSAGTEYSIYDRAGAGDMLRDLHSCMDGCETAPSPWQETTPREAYLDRVDELIGRLRRNGGKTVISRTIASHDYKVDWAIVAEKYFEIHREALCYLYYTPLHGFWLGASPEVLYQSDGIEFSTMALAGTRNASEAGNPWSGKNLAEQAIVRDYISERLYDLGLAPVAGDTETVDTGNLQHLRTIITGCKEGMEDTEILSALNPTPALAGYPLASALENIVEIESHPRRCYGGYVAIKDGIKFMAYVNLRCVNFDSDSWCMYVGGGIMPDSDCESEWAETEAKSYLLRRIIEEHKES